jgi:hypothetical protein
MTAWRQAQRAPSADHLRLGVAAWLVDETALSFDQIAKYAEISTFEVECIANDTLTPRLTPVDPIHLKWLEAADIAFCQDNPDCALPISSIRDSHIQLTPLPFSDELADRILWSAGLCQLYFVFYGRNAWHSTWVQRYFAKGAVCASLKEAKRRAERSRKQGNVLYIDVLPAVFLKMDARTLFVVEINASNLASRLVESMDSARCLAQVLEDVRRYPANSVVALTSDTPITLFELATAEFQQYQAEAPSSVAILDWRRRSSDGSAFTGIRACAEKASLYVGVAPRALRLDLVDRE